MPSKSIICPQCGVSYDSYIHPICYSFTNLTGICETCQEENRGLIERHIDGAKCYVPWSEGFQIILEENGEIIERPIEEEWQVFELPSLRWCNEYRKWKLSLSNADIGGFDCEPHVYYFDNTEELLVAMKNFPVNKHKVK